MPNQLQLTGFTELQRGLASLPTDLQQLAVARLAVHAERAVEALKATYPEITGALRAGVKLIPRVPRGIAALFTVTSSAPYAHIYEFGSVHQRPRATFLPIAHREQRESTLEIVAIVTGAGIQVTGSRD